MRRFGPEARSLDSIRWRTFSAWLTSEAGCAMTPQGITGKKRIIYLLIALGFAGLIGAHEITPADENADFTLPLLVAGAGTLSFVAAGLLARNLLKRMA